MAVKTTSTSGIPFVVPGPPGSDGGQGLPGTPGSDGRDGTDGRDGRDGVDGAGTIVQRTAAVTIPPSTNVVDNGDGTVSPADPSNPAHCGKLVGIVLAFTPVGTLASITLLGPLSGVTGSFSPGQRLWIGPGGICTATPPTSGWRQTIGVAGTGGNITYQPGRAALYNPTSPLVLVSLADPAGLIALLAAALAADPDGMTAFVSAALDSLPPIPADIASVPPGGRYYRDVDAAGERILKVIPPQVSP
ncbi:hypothetical protein [Methylobacterium sp. Gmos1]